VTNEDSDGIASLEVVAGQVERQLDLQWEHWDSVDGRLRLLLGFVGAIFVVTLAFTNPTSEVSDLGRSLLIAAIVVLILAGVVAFLAWLPRLFDRPPDPRALREQYLASPPNETRLSVLDTMIQAYGENEIRITEKLNGFRVAAWLLGAAVLLIAIAGIIELAG